MFTTTSLLALFSVSGALTIALLVGVGARVFAPAVAASLAARFGALLGFTFHAGISMSYWFWRGGS